MLMGVQPVMMVCSSPLLSDAPVARGSGNIDNEVFREAKHILFVQHFAGEEDIISQQDQGAA